MSPSSCLTSLLIVALMAHSLAQTTTESSSDSIHDLDDVPRNNASDGAEHEKLEDSCSMPRYHPINQNIQFYGNGDPRSAAATEKLLNLTGTILTLLQNQEPRYTPRPSPILGRPTDHLLNLTGTILAFLQNQEPRYTPRPTPILVSGNPRDCAEIQESGKNTSGIYPIFPDGDGNPFFVSCDMETDGGGWTIFQRREDGSVDFFREWADYKHGFGSVYSEHWLGNENIHRLAIVVQKTYELRVDLEDFSGQTRYARYSTFYVADEDANYTMTLGEYSGDAGDSLASHHSGHQFSTKDRDNDDSSTDCASTYKGAWWYNRCHHSNLNGLYLSGTNSQPDKGVTWKDWRGQGYSLKKTEMKIRPIVNRNTN